MATYKQIGYGSQGSEVTELQKLLNSNGSYNLATDGIFGDKTKAAVMDYQEKNNLDVDGIVGDNTWGALTKSNASSTGSSSSASAATNTPTFEYGAYKPSDTVAQAEALLQQQLANKPGSYQSSWQGQLSDIIQNIQNRDKFSYNVNEDALYQQLKDQYVLQGQMASMDVMGQAAAMTGGYGNSFAQTAGQQAYQGYLQQLNDRVPELYGMALDQYNQEGQALYDQAALFAQMEDQDYGRYRDQISDYYAEIDRLTEDARYQGEQDYGRYLDGYQMGYGEYRDSVADSQWQAEFDEAKRQYDQQYELAAGKQTGGTETGPTGGDDNYRTAPEDTDPTDGVTYTQNGSLTKGKVMTLQRILGVTADGIFGPKTQAAANGMSADEAYNYYVLGKGKPNDGGTGFTGSSYSEAAAYIKSNGGSASGLMTQSEWQRHRNSYLKTGQSNAEGANYSSYTEYLKDFVEYATQ